MEERLVLRRVYRNDECRQYARDARRDARLRSREAARKIRVAKAQEPAVETGVIPESDTEYMKQIWKDFVEANAQWSTLISTAVWTGTGTGTGTGSSVGSISGYYVGDGPPTVDIDGTVTYSIPGQPNSWASTISNISFTT